METHDQIKNILENEIKPLLAMHGGGADFVGFEEGIVKLKLNGACHGCMLSEVTLKAGVEEILKSKIPQVKGVEAVNE